jgi:hypothetical protein
MYKVASVTAACVETRRCTFQRSFIAYVSAHLRQLDYIITRILSWQCVPRIRMSAVTLRLRRSLHNGQYAIGTSSE